MKDVIFKISLGITALIFIIYFGTTVIPAFLETKNIIEAINGGFVNPYSSAYSMDAILSWVVLTIWVIYESKKVKHGWICLLLGLFPGVAVGFALYLVLRMNSKN